MDPLDQLTNRTTVEAFYWDQVILKYLLIFLDTLLSPRGEQDTIFSAVMQAEPQEGGLRSLQRTCAMLLAVPQASLCPWVAECD